MVWKGGSFPGKLRKNLFKSNKFSHILMQVGSTEKLQGKILSTSREPRETKEEKLLSQMEMVKLHKGQNLYPLSLFFFSF